MSDQTTIPESYKTTFKDNLRLALQQKGSKLRGTVDEGPYSGKGAMAVDIIGATESQAETDRYGDTPLMVPDHQSRWVFPKGTEWGTLITDYDKVREITDPTSKISMNARNALGRDMDDAIINAFYASAPTGENGATGVAFDTGNIVNVQLGSGDTPADTGLNYDKLIAITEHFANVEMDDDDEPIYIGVGPKQNTNLLNQIEVISNQYNVKPSIGKNGKITEFMGINFAHSRRFQKTGNNRLCPVWSKTGMHLGVWDDLDVRAGPDATKKFNTRLYAKLVIGASRVDEKKVMQIPCKE